MTTSRENLRNLCRRRIGDSSPPYTFSDLQINQWINDAIADYTIHFPRILNTEINCVDADCTYDLPSDFIAVIGVEYPSGDDPPIYLTRRNYTHPDFWIEDGFYDIINRDSQVNSYELWISTKPSTDESIAVQYLGEHAWLDDDSDPCTVLDRHLELITLFVRWAACQELASSEAADPDPTSQNLGILEQNASRAKQDYREKLEAWKAASATSETASWSPDRWDRVY